jgi:DNA polymerase I-like protein with 3'-5' exonuclease and polymerase domains
MNICIIDFETIDPYISQGYGPGWVFAIRGYQIPEFRILGASVKTLSTNEEIEFKAEYISDLIKLKELISYFDTFVMHNAQYDIGCMLHLFGVDPSGIRKFLANKTFYDTMLMAKLTNQHKFSYSLEKLSKEGKGAVKQKSTLTDYVWESGMFQAHYKDTHTTQKHTRPSEEVLSEFAFSNLDKIPEDIVGSYCNADVEATYSLFANYEQQLLRFPKEFKWERYSTLLKACVDMKARGVDIDVPQAIKTRKMLEGKIESLTSQMTAIVGHTFNINAPKQVLQVMQELGLSGFSKTAKGVDSVNKEWFKTQTHEVCKLLVQIKNYEKLSRDFLTKLIDYQHIHVQNGSDSTKIFPSLNIFGATATGRFSSSGTRKGKKSYELNIQQIPIRGLDEEAGRYVRACFVAPKGSTWLSADYSNQEQRLQVHFANYLSLPGAAEFLQKLISNPDADFHQTVADFCHIARTPAKTINLGLAYGMGGAKLCRSLGLPTQYVWSNKQGREIEVPGEEGEDILKTYHKFLAFMKPLQTYVNDTLYNYKYVKTLAGRKLNIDPPMKIDGEWITFERKGLSKLVQGSGADVTIEAIINCYKAGLQLLFTVHDEINIISQQVEIDRVKLEQCMNANVCKEFNLCLPMKVDVSGGLSWAD